MIKLARLLVLGRVQGVFFRASCAQIARSLSLLGFVRNVPDGSVEVLAEGDESRVARLIDWCRKGPMGARVEHVQVEWKEPEGHWQDFRIH